MTIRTKALLAIALSAVLWATAGSTSKLLFLTANPIVAASHRFLLASLVILPFFLTAKKPNGYIRHLLPLGLLNAGNVLFYYLGLYYSTANTASVLGTLTPVTASIFAALFLSERIPVNTIIGIGLSFLGASIIVLLPSFTATQTAHGSILGNLFLLSSLLCWTGYIVYSRHVLKNGIFPATLSTSINMFTVALTATGVALFTGKSLVSSIYMSPTYLGLLFYAATGFTIVTFFLFQWGIRHVSASTASLKEYLQLVLSVSINTIVLSERLSMPFFLGSILIVLGVVLATRQRPDKKMVALEGIKEE